MILVIRIMKFRTEVSIVKDGFNLNVADNIVLLGSCFTKNIGTKLVDYKFNCDVNAFGVLYNPMSICRSLDSLLSGEDFPYEKYLFQNGEMEQLASFRRFLCLCTRTMLTQHTETCLRM